MARSKRKHKSPVTYVKGAGATTPSGKPKPTGIYMPDEKDRKYVYSMSSYGLTHEDVANITGIAVHTLRRHFGRELATALQQKNVKVARSLYKNATKGRNVVAQIFWLKCMAGWRSEQPVAPQIPLPNMDTSRLSTKKLELLEELLKECMVPTKVLSATAETVGNG